MISLADVEIDLFGKQLPSLEELRQLAGYVNGSESRRLAFAGQIENIAGNSLASGIGLVMLGRNADALKSLKRAGDCKEKFVYMSYACCGLEMYDEAIAALDKAEKNQAEPLMVTLEKVAVLRLAGKYEQAGKELKKCANFEGVSAEYHYQLGRLAESTGDYEQAGQNYEILLELDPDHCQGLFRMAYLHDLHGDELTAIDYYRQTINCAPTHVSALLNLSVLYEDMNSHKRAVACVETVLESHPNHKKALLFYKDIESSKVMVYDEDKERRRDRHNKILEIPISDFELSVRSRNCLKKMNLITLGDLLRISEVELLSYKNFGETSLLEVKKILDSKNLRLGMALEDSAAAYAEGLEMSGASEEMLNKSVDDLELSVRARRCLSRLNIRTFGELISKTEAELLGCKNFGVTSLNEIKERLTGFGLSLRRLE